MTYTVNIDIATTTKTTYLHVFESVSSHDIVIRLQGFVTKYTKAKEVSANVLLLTAVFFVTFQHCYSVSRHFHSLDRLDCKLVFQRYWKKPESLEVGGGGGEGVEPIYLRLHCHYQDGFASRRPLMQAILPFQSLQQARSPHGVRISQLWKRKVGWDRFEPGFICWPVKLFTMLVKTLYTTSEALCHTTKRIQLTCRCTPFQCPLHPSKPWHQETRNHPQNINFF